MSRQRKVVHLIQGWGTACGLHGEDYICTLTIRGMTCKQCARTHYARKLIVARLRGEGFDFVKSTIDHFTYYSYNRRDRLVI